MTFTRGLFIHPDATRGTTALEARQALAGLITSPGVLDGLRVTGTAGWQYSVPAGHVATSRDIDVDGVVLFGNDAPVLVDCAPAPGTGARIDIIYAKHNDATSPNADPNSEAFAAVAEGVASGTPTAPELPEGGVELARATVGAGATNTAHANVTISHANTTRAHLHGNQVVAGRRYGDQTTSLPNSTQTLISGGSNGDYSGGIAGASGGITVPVGGWYQVSCGVRFNSNSSGSRNVYMQVNGIDAQAEQSPANGFTTVTISTLLRLSAGDLLTMAGWQSSGGTLGTSGSFGYPYIGAALVGQG